MEQKIVEMIRALPWIGKQQEITLDSGLFSDLDLDSSSALMLFAQIEDTFNVEIKSYHVVSFKTVGDLCRFVSIIAACGGFRLRKTSGRFVIGRTFKM